ncbi:unnamed protein product [Tetraodon nigroviridis]|uniref:(spotted green pufferfish) hypothetical protein n=1 Tax=Tetraodon nigroviridis TaxID=99883 RepID=Q4RU32_TETNG|nr:unnamed protein product [Tetraodon nigroviridis]
MEGSKLLQASQCECVSKPPATPRRSRQQAGERSAFPRSSARHVSRSPQQLEVCERGGEPCTTSSPHTHMCRLISKHIRDF